MTAILRDRAGNETRRVDWHEGDQIEGDGRRFRFSAWMVEGRIGVFVEVDATKAQTWPDPGLVLARAMYGDGGSPTVKESLEVAARTATSLEALLAAVPAGDDSLAFLDAEEAVAVEWLRKERGWICTHPKEAL